MFLFILASFVEAYYLYKSTNANKRDIVPYILLSVCCLPIIPIIIFFISYSYSIKEFYREVIKMYRFELLVYIGILIAGIVLW